jgi:hypothetical protein
MSSRFSCHFRERAHHNGRPARPAAGAGSDVPIWISALPGQKATWPSSPTRRRERRLASDVAQTILSVLPDLAISTTPPGYTHSSQNHHRTNRAARVSKRWPLPLNPCGTQLNRKAACVPPVGQPVSRNMFPGTGAAITPHAAPIASGSSADTSSISKRLTTQANPSRARQQAVASNRSIPSPGRNARHDPPQARNQRRARIANRVGPAATPRGRKPTNHASPSTRRRRLARCGKSFRCWGRGTN